MFKRTMLLMGLIGLCTVSLAQAAPRSYAPVQDGFVRDAESVLPWAEGRVLVKFTAAALRESVLNEGGLKAAGPVTATGLGALDVVLQELGVTDIRPAHRPVANKALGARLGVEQWYRIDLPADADVPAAAARLAQDPGLEYAEPDLRAFPAVVPNDPLYGDNWGHDNTAQLPDFGWGTTWSHTGPGVGTAGFDANADVAWNGSQGYGDNGVVIAILDSGVDTSHPDLNLMAGYDFGDGDSNPNDNSAQPGHGTACAGVAAAIANNNLGVVGAAGGCTVMPLKVADSGGSLYFSYIVNAIYHAADNGADVISMSFGAAGVTSNSSMDAAISYANSQGVTLLAATGNENDNTISYPAYNTFVIGVGAASPCGDRKRSSSNSSEVNPGVNTDPNGYTCDGERWWGSNYGLNTQDHQGAVDILAPTILPTTDISGSGGYQSGDYEPFFNGTSCATPYAAGVCALIISANPTFTPAQVRAQLVDTAQDVTNVESGAGWDRFSGYGMVDAAAAVGGGTPAAPVADFDVSVTSGCASLAVNFTDQSTGTIDTWSWTFGDGGTSSAQSPVHTYNTPGVYSVSLTVNGPGGSDSFTMNNAITVDGAPTTAFSAAPTTITVGDAVAFTDASTDAQSWSWTFGDGGTSTAANPVHTYTVPGLYTVSLTTTNACGSDNQTQTNLVTVNPPPAPVAAFNASVTSGCASLNVDFSDESTGTIDSWSWTFGDGGTSTAQNPNHVYNAPGAYDVSLTATNLGGSDTLTMTGLITVDGPPAAGFTAAPNVITAGETVTFTDTSTDAQSWSWTFGDGGTSTVQNPTHTYTVPGLYTVQLVAGNACGDDTSLQTDLITVNAPPAPVASFSASVTSGCAPLSADFSDASTGTIDSWSWTFGDGGTSTAQNPNHVYSTPGVYDVSLTVTNLGGSDTSTMTGLVTVDGPPTAAFTAAPTNITAGDAVTFTDTSTDAQSWSSTFGDGGTSTAQNPVHTYLLPGVYSVQLVASNGCGDDTILQTDLITVDTPPAPVAVFSASATSGCAPLTVDFTDESLGDIDTWAWTFDDGGTSNAQSPSHEYAAPGIYDVALTVTGLGGSDTLTMTGMITVGGPPSAAFTAAPTTITAGNAVTFTDTSTDALSWAWSFGDGGTSVDQNPVHTYAAAGSYTVRLIATNDCGSNTLIVADQITVNPPAPVADFTFDPAAGCAPLGVAFTDASTGDITGWQWEFGDIGTDTAQSPTHLYTLPGSFDVRLIVTGPGGADTLTVTDAVTVGGDVTAAFAVSVPIGTVPLAVTFTDQSLGAPTSWLWDFGDGNTDTAASPTHTYTTIGTWHVRLIVSNGCDSDTLLVANAVAVNGTSGTDPLLPARFGLEQNYPNPFNPMTTLSYSLEAEGRARLEVYDMSGRRLAVLVDAVRPAGRHELIWQPRDLVSGIYFVKFTARGESETRRVTLLK